MKRIHKKVLIVIRLKVVEILIVLGCMIAFSAAVCGFAWLTERLKAGEAVAVIFAWILAGIAAIVCLIILAGAIYAWIGWNWGKAEKIVRRNEEQKRISSYTPGESGH